VAGKFDRERTPTVGAIATAATISPIATVSISFTSLPWIASTLIELSARFVTSARSPARLMARPEGCLPTSTVAMCAAGSWSGR